MADLCNVLGVASSICPANSIYGLAHSYRKLAELTTGSFASETHQPSKQEKLTFSINVLGFRQRNYSINYISCKWLDEMIHEGIYGKSLTVIYNVFGAIN